MNAGSVLAQFTVTLTKPATEPVSVLWRTVDGTAKAGVDYAAGAGTVVFSPGEVSKTLDVLVYGRAVGSEDRTFSVLLLPPGNAILGQEVAECIITVDTTGSTPVIDIILPDGPQGAQGKSAYQSWLDTGHTGTEEDFVNWLRPTPEEIANEIAPQINVGDSSLTTKDTSTLPHPDMLDVKTLSKRVAYADVALIATVVLGDGDNTIQQSDFTGDPIDFRSPFISFRIFHAGAMVDADWSVGTDGKLTIKAATAGDVLYGVEYRLVQKKAYPLTANNNNLAADVRAILRANISAAMSGINSDITSITGLNTPITAPEAVNSEQLATLGQSRGYIGQVVWHTMRSKPFDGGVALDGQAVTVDGPFADLKAHVVAGNEPTCTEAEWQADPTKRGCYVIDIGDGRMRLPDRNGVQPGSIKSPTLKGDGGTLAAGSMQRDAAPEISALITFASSNNSTPVLDASGAAAGEVPYTNSFTSGNQTAGANSFGRVHIAASASSPSYGRDGATEVRVNANVGCFMVRYAGSVMNAGSLDALTLSARMEEINSDLQAKNIATNARIGQTVVSVTNPALGSRTTIANPFGNNTPVTCRAEFFHATLNQWVSCNWLYNSTSGVTVGLSAAYADGVGISLVVGSAAYSSSSAVSATSVPIPDSSYATPSPVRIHITKVTA